MCSPKAINIIQYLNKSNFVVNNRHCVIKSSQATQLYITKVFYQFSHHHIETHFFVANINHTIRTKPHTTCLVFYIFHFWRYSTSVFLILTRKQSYFVTNHHIKKSFCVTKLFKINIFYFSSITRLKHEPTRRFLYYFQHFWRYLTSVFLDPDMNKNIFRQNLAKINIFRFSSITQ